MTATPRSPFLLGRPAATCVALGLLLLGAGYLGVSMTPTLEAQLPWVALAACGTVLAAAGQAVWLLHGMTVVARLRRDVASTIRADIRAAAAHVDTGADCLVSVKGTRRAHRPTCLLVAGKPTATVTPRRRLDPCEVCRPQGQPLL